MIIYKDIKIFKDSSNLYSISDIVDIFVKENFYPQMSDKFEPRVFIMEFGYPKCIKIRIDIVSSSNFGYRNTAHDSTCSVSNLENCLGDVYNHEMFKQDFFSLIAKKIRLYKIDRLI